MTRKVHGFILSAALAITAQTYAQPAPAVGPATATDRPAAKQDAPKPDPQQQRIAELIQQLGADDFAKRDEASEELQKMGADALPALREALKHDDPSIRSYAEYLVPKIEGRKNNRRVQNQFQPQGVVAVPARRAGVREFVAANNRITVNVTEANGLKTINVTEGDRQTRIEEAPDQVRMTVSDATTGKILEETKAKSVEELIKIHPQVGAIYENYVNGRGRALVAPRAIRIAPGMPGGVLELDVRDQLKIQDAQRRQDRLLEAHQARIRDLLDGQNRLLQDQQLDALHKRLKAETEMLERQLAEVEAMHARLLEQTKAAQKRLADLEKQQQTEPPK